MTIITFGVFDLTHAGHFALFRRMKAGGNRVVVFVQDSSSVPATKHGRRTVLTTSERVAAVRACRWVDDVRVYRWLGARQLARVPFDVLAVGQEHPSDERFQRMFKWCRERGKAVKVFPRTPGVSTTDLIARVRGGGHE